MDAEIVLRIKPALTQYLHEFDGCFGRVSRRHLDTYGLPYRGEPRLVRGIDYYTRVTFEITEPSRGRVEAVPLP